MCLERRNKQQLWHNSRCLETTKTAPLIGSQKTYTPKIVTNKPGRYYKRVLSTRIMTRNTLHGLICCTNHTYMLRVCGWSLEKCLRSRHMEHPITNFGENTFYTKHCKINSSARFVHYIDVRLISWDSHFPRTDKWSLYRFKPLFPEIYWASWTRTLLDCFNILAWLAIRETLYISNRFRTLRWFGSI